jgi:hypothetical protein
MGKSFQWPSICEAAMAVLFNGKTYATPTKERRMA